MVAGCVWRVGGERGRAGRGAYLEIGLSAWGEAGRVWLPLALESKKGFFEAIAVNLLAVERCGGIVGEVVGKAGAEEVDGAVAESDAVQRGRLVEVDVRRREQRGQPLLQKLL